MVLLTWVGSDNFTRAHSFICGPLVGRLDTEQSSNTLGRMNWLYSTGSLTFLTSQWQGGRGAFSQYWQSSSGSTQDLLSVSLQWAHHHVCHIVLAQTGHKASRDSSVGEVDCLMGKAVKSCCKRCGLREALFTVKLTHTFFLAQ